MFNFLTKKAQKFAKSWDKKQPDELLAKEKSLYALAGKIQKSRIADPGSVLVDQAARDRIRENFYHKYFNLMGPKQPAQSVMREQKLKQPEPRKELSMTLQPKLQPKFKMTLVYVAVGVIVLALALGYYFTRPGAIPNGKPGMALVAHLAATDGQVETWNGSEWRTVSVGDTFARDSQLRTGESSRAVLEFDEGSALRFDENSHVILREVNNQKIAVLQVAGETYSRVNKTSGLTYEVKSGDTEITAVGTAFGVASETSNFVKKGEKKVIVKVVESKVKVKIIKGDETLEKEVSEGEELIVDMTKPIEDAAKKIPLVKEETIKDGFYAWNREEDNKKSYPLGIMDDITPPEIKITEPLDGIETELVRVAIKGQTETGAKVLVNGTLIENKEGSFEKVIDLKVGENTVEVKAKDDSGNAAVKKITVIRKGTAAQTLPLYLKGWAGTDGVHLSWALSGVSAPKGFKLVKSLDAYPTFPEDPYVYLNPETRSYIWKITDGKTYHFRVCIYDGSSCGTYSNDAKLTTKLSGASSKGEIYGTLALTGWIKTQRIVYLSWALSGNAPYGYKLMKSFEPNPTYPGNEYVYISSPDLKGGYAWDLGAPGTYHFRVCAYNGAGGCAFYSNDHSITVQ